MGGLYEAGTQCGNEPRQQGVTWIPALSDIVAVPLLHPSLLGAFLRGARMAGVGGGMMGRATGCGVCSGGAKRATPTSIAADPLAPPPVHYHLIVPLLPRIKQSPYLFLS
jgi:hypothetical protein